MKIAVAACLSSWGPACAVRIGGVLHSGRAGGLVGPAVVVLGVPVLSGAAGLALGDLHLAGRLLPGSLPHVLGGVRVLARPVGAVVWPALSPFLGVPARLCFVVLACCSGAPTMVATCPWNCAGAHAVGVTCPPISPGPHSPALARGQSAAWPTAYRGPVRPFRPGHTVITIPSHAIVTAPPGGPSLGVRVARPAPPGGHDGPARPGYNAIPMPGRVVDTALPCSPRLGVRVARSALPCGHAWPARPSYTTVDTALPHVAGVKPWGGAGVFRVGRVRAFLEAVAARCSGDHLCRRGLLRGCQKGGSAGRSAASSCPNRAPPCQ
mmetsp:Transcript_45467/g.102964  ORF Transcript_45467/g.102964 Transcript_45467/m.102964 type:complete len:323 (-) Transcript_45467:936-1904(-)